MLRHFVNLSFRRRPIKDLGSVCFIGVVWRWRNDPAPVRLASVINVKVGFDRRPELPFTSLMSHLGVSPPLSLSHSHSHTHTHINKGVSLTFSCFSSSPCFLHLSLFFTVPLPLCVIARCLSSLHLCHYVTICLCHCLPLSLGVGHFVFATMCVYVTPLLWESVYDSTSLRLSHSISFSLSHCVWMCV